jgi:hypothetical protein
VVQARIQTGASSISMPFSASLFAISRVATGEMVIMSTTTVPDLTPSMMPFGPKITCSTSGVSDTITNTTSARTAASPGLAHAVAPASASGCMDSLRRAHTTIAWPAFMTFSACGRPMIPSPTNPAFTLRSFLKTSKTN